MHLVGSLVRCRALAPALAIGVAAALSGACTSTSTSSTAPSSSKCQVDANADPSQFSASGGRGTLAIRAARDCSWTISPQAAWVSVAGVTSGQGDASVPYSVAGNPRPVARAGDLLVGDARLQVTQAAAPCTFRFARNSDGIGAEGGTISVRLETIEGCGWTAVSDAVWLSVSRGGAGTASGTIEIAVSVNAGASRTGSVRVGTELFSVTQAAGAQAPPPSPAPSPGPTPSPTPSPSPAPAPAPEPAPAPTPVSLDGTVAGLTGTCPTLAFSISGRPATTSSRTNFKDNCTRVSNGDTVRVRGLASGDGPVDVTELEIRKDAR